MTGCGWGWGCCVVVVEAAEEERDEPSEGVLRLVLEPSSDAAPANAFG